MNILHLNDLHINHPENEEEALRTAFYPEYFESLFYNLNRNQIKINYIFITGDIVHKGYKDFYAHACSIITYVAKLLSVESNNIYLVNGNHDISKDSGNMVPFEELSLDFGNYDHLIAEGDRYKFFKDNDYGIICLDSIGPNYTTGNPSPFSKKEKDSIVEVARNRNLKDLFVLSHHPPESFEVQSQAPFDEGSPDWSGKHIWHDGGNLYRRLASRTTIKGNIFWFAGDIHRPEHCIINKHQILIITGSVNAFEKKGSSIQPQVRVISPGSPQCSELYEYKFSGHNRLGLEGNWECKEVKAHVFDTNTTTKTKICHISVDNKELDDHESACTESQLIVINKKLERRIHEQVREKQLYEFGRFETNKDITSLSWVSIHNLLESYSVFSSIINAFRYKLISLLPSGIEKKDCLLVGVDTWGSILASRLGAATNIRSCCVAVRSKQNSYDNVERINDELKSIVRGKKIAFVISDVIATGNSIVTIRNELGCSECPNWYNFTIFCDPTQRRDICFRGYKETYYICGTVKMPIINSSNLPGVDILKPDISFV